MKVSVFLLVSLFVFTGCFVAVPVHAVAIELTPSERAWLKVHQDITLSFVTGLEPLVIVNGDPSSDSQFILSEYYLVQALSPKFAPLIKESSRFWNASGIHVSGGVLSGLSVSMESLDSLMTGGIALATPEKDKEKSGIVKGGHSFTLYEEAKDAWSKWSPVLTAKDVKEK